MKVFALICLNVVMIGVVSGSMDGVTVTASTYEETASWCKDGTCAPEHTVDGDLTAGSSWRADGAEVWIAYDLGAVKSVESVKLMFVKGSTRNYFIGIDLSVDGSTWVPAIERDTTAGADGWESFDFEDKNARFVRIRGYGNTNTSFPTWTNIIETDIQFSDPSTGMMDIRSMDKWGNFTGILLDLQGRQVRRMRSTGIYLEVAGREGMACLTARPFFWLNN